MDSFPTIRSPEIRARFLSRPGQICNADTSHLHMHGHARSDSRFRTLTDPSFSLHPLPFLPFVFVTWPVGNEF